VVKAVAQEVKAEVQAAVTNAVGEATGVDVGVATDVLGARKKGGTAQQNKKDGTRREQEAKKDLQAAHPEGSVQSEQYLRDKDGKIARDPVTGEARRIDNVVIQDGKAVRAQETTSMTADKRAQTQKEERIRESGGTMVRDRETRDLVDFKDVQTEMDRRD